MSEQQPEVCRFWEIISEDGQDPRDSVGWCRRYPPIPSVYREPDEPLDPERSELLVSEFSFPIAAAYHWCGEHQPREASSEP